MTDTLNAILRAIAVPYDLLAVWNLAFGSFTAIVYLIRTRSSATPPISSGDAALLMANSLIQFLMGFVCFLLHGDHLRQEHGLAVLAVGIPLITALVTWYQRRPPRGRAQI